MKIVATGLLLAVSLMAYGESPAVVVGSAHIADIVRDLTGATVSTSVQSLIPPTMCPGHFDARPSDISAVKRARYVLIHDWQTPMGGIRSVLESAEVPATRVHVISAPGNWLAPPVQSGAVEEIVAVLTQLDPSRADEYKAASVRRNAAIEAAGVEVSKQLSAAGCGGMKVLCHDKLTGFLKWAGFDVIGEYGRDGQLSAGGMAKLVRDARSAGVVLVADNLQGGAIHTGAALARDTGAAHVILSNFPGGFTGVDTCEQTLRKNVELLTRAAPERSKK